MVGGCASKSVTVTQSQDLPHLLGRRVTMIGTALHSCPGAIVFDKNYMVSIEGMTYWPKNFDQQRVQVTGLLQQRRAPDLYEIYDAHWTLLP